MTLRLVYKQPSSVPLEVEGVIPEAIVDKTLAEATLRRGDDEYQRSGGRTGYHTEHLGHLLSEMQWMQRSYPGLEW